MEGDGGGGGEDGRRGVGGRRGWAKGLEWAAVGWLMEEWALGNTVKPEVAE